MDQIKFNVLNFGEITQGDDRAKNKIVQHLFNNEKWLKGTQGDGKLDVGELEFFSKNFLNENNEVDYDKYVSWQKANMNVGSTVHDSFSFKDIKEFFQLFPPKQTVRELEKPVDVNFSKETYMEILKDDPIVQENKVLQHLFKNERYLNDDKEFDGKLDADEIQRFLNKFVINGEMTVTSFETWRQEQLAVGNENLKDVTYEDMKEFLDIVQGKPKSQLPPPLESPPPSELPSLSIDESGQVILKVGDISIALDGNLVGKILNDWLYGYFGANESEPDSDAEEYYV